MQHDSGLTNPDYMQTYFDSLESVLTRSLTAPPAAPADGARYLVPIGATGDWAGYDNEITIWHDQPSPGYWEFIPINDDGTSVWVEDENNILYYDFPTDTWLVGSIVGHNHDDRYFQKSQFIDAYTGNPGEPIKTDTNGVVQQRLMSRYTYAGNPNGHLTAPAGSTCRDTIRGTL